MRIPKKFKKPVTYTFRCKLPDGGIPFTGPAAISNDLAILLRDQDPALELIYNRHANRIEAYRVKSRGAAPSGDQLVHQFTLKNKPGPWLIVYLRENDLWRRFGSSEKATKAILGKLDSDDFYVKAEQKAVEIARSFCKSASEYMRKAKVYGV